MEAHSSTHNITPLFFTLTLERTVSGVFLF
nr:MAG TPA: hypothetical protein [Caudoviricetes sp.]